MSKRISVRCWGGEPWPVRLPIEFDGRQLTIRDAEMDLEDLIAAVKRAAKRPNRHPALRWIRYRPRITLEKQRWLAEPVSTQGYYKLTVEVYRALSGRYAVRLSAGDYTKYRMPFSRLKRALIFLEQHGASAS